MVHVYHVVLCSPYFERCLYIVALLLEAYLTLLRKSPLLFFIHIGTVHYFYLKCLDLNKFEIDV